MLANIIIMVLILGYCAFLIYKSIKNSKEGKHMGCSGCSTDHRQKETAEIGGVLNWEIQQVLLCICSEQL